MEKLIQKDGEMVMNKLCRVIIQRGHDSISGSPRISINSKYIKSNHTRLVCASILFLMTVMIVPSSYRKMQGSEVKKDVDGQEQEMGSRGWPKPQKRIV